MSDKILSVRQRELLAAVTSTAQKLRSDADDSRPVGLGDLFVLEATAEFPVEWVLVERRDPAGPFLAVPGDSHPFLGSRDLEVETSAGFLNLRCQAGAPLDPAALEPGRRTGALRPGEIERARLKIQEIDQKGFVPDPFLEEVDLSPEYEEWLRTVVRPARAAAGSPRVVLPFKPAVQPRSKPSLSWWAAAAAVFLLSSSMLALWVLRQHRRIEDLEARSRSSAMALLGEQARRDWEQRNAATALQEKEKQMRELQDRLAALEGRLKVAAQPLLNPPVAILQPAEVLRGTPPQSYRLPAAASLTIVLKFRETEAYPMYRLVLTQQGSAKPIWQTNGLERSPEGVQLTLPRGYLPPGEYRLNLLGLRSGKAQPITDYKLKLTP